MVFNDKEKKAIYKYYKYKNEYENERKDKINKIKKKHKGNEKEIQTQIARIKLPCTYCKRNVNTKFIKEESKLIIMCGDSNSPCSDKLEILLPNYIHVNKGIELFEAELDLFRNKIVKVRADLTYEFIEEEEAINEFQSLNEEFNGYAELYTSLLLYKGNIEEDKEREHMIISKIGEIKDVKQRCSEILKQYQKKPTIQLLNDYIEMISCKLFPLKQKMQHIIYSFQEVISREKDIDEKGYGSTEYTLIQRKNLFELYEHIWDKYDGVDIMQNGKKRDSINEISIDDSEESRRNKNNEEDNEEEFNEDNNEGNNEDNSEGNNEDNNGVNNGENGNDNNNNLEEVEIGVGNVQQNDEPVQLRPKNNEYETDSDDDEEDEDE